jgi:hypothetical protein
MVQGEVISDEYVGLEYPTALDLHLYFCTTRDILEWAMQNGLKTYYSGSSILTGQRRVLPACGAPELRRP